jgi:hypothetical protein
MVDNRIRDSVAPRATVRVTHLPSALPPDLLSVLTLLKSTYRANPNPKPSENVFLGSQCAIDGEIQRFSLPHRKKLTADICREIFGSWNFSGQGEMACRMPRKHGRKLRERLYARIPRLLVHLISQFFPLSRNSAASTDQLPQLQQGRSRRRGFVRPMRLDIAQSGL